MEGLKRKVVYTRPALFKRWLISFKILLLSSFNSEKMDLYFRVINGDNISEPIKDLVYKSKKDNVFKSVRLGIVINDEIMNDYINIDSRGKSFIEGVFRQGEGILQLIKLDPNKLNFVGIDIRLNDIFQDTARKLLKLFEWDKEKSVMMMFLVSGLIAMGLFIAFGLTGLGNILNAGLEKMAGEVMSAVPVANIPVAP